MQVDGRAIAQELLQQLTDTVGDFAVPPSLGIVVCAPDVVTQQYLRLKQAKAEAVGVVVQVTMLPASATTAETVAAVEELATTVDGLVVQLPLPVTIDRDQVLGAIPATLDVDALRPGVSDFLSPVVRAIAEILHRHTVALEEKTALVFGAGRLVGRPVAEWLKTQEVTVRVVTDDDAIEPEAIQAADIIVLGAGQPGLLTPEMITTDTIVLDAGTSESSGRIRGDADPACATKAALYTPVPGGIGPITVATLLANVVEAATKERV